MTARPAFNSRRPSARPAPASILIHDPAGHFLGGVEAADIRWRAITWCYGAGEFLPVPGSYPGEGPARTALARRLAR